MYTILSFNIMIFLYFLNDETKSRKNFINKKIFVNII